MAASTTTLREYLLIVQEPQLMVPVHATAAAAGLFVAQTASPIAPPTSSTPPATLPNAIFIRIDGGNAFSMRPKPVTEDIMSGGGYAYIGQTVSGRTSVVGNLQTKLYASQAPFLLGWATQLVNGATVTFPDATSHTARTLPWVTLAPSSGVGGTAVGDLASCSLYHAIKKSDGTYKCRLYAGVKVMGGTLSCSADSQIVTLSLNLQGCKIAPCGNDSNGVSLDSTNTGGATPVTWANDITQVDSATLNDPHKIPDPVWFPYDPLLFTHSKGKLELYDGTAVPSTHYRTQYSSININFGNRCDARYFEERFATYIQFLGRQATLTAKLLYKPGGATGMSTYEDRIYAESLKAMTMNCSFANGVSTTKAISNVSFTFNAQNVIRDLADDTPVDRVYEQTVAVQNIYDYTGGVVNDFSFAWIQNA